jgi:hypothetical protein
MKDSHQIAGSIRRLVAIGGIAVCAAGCASHDESDNAGTFGDPHVVTKLHDLGLQASSADGVPAPTKMYAVEVSDHQAAEAAVSGDIVYDHAPVFVIVVVGGTFIANGASVPLGASTPQGSVLTITLEAATYDVTDWGVSNVEPDLSKVASARVDLLAR